MQEQTLIEPTLRSSAHSNSLSHLLERLTEGRLLFILVAVTVLVYTNSLGGDFVFDDREQIVNNLRIRSWDNLLKAFTTDVWAFRSDLMSKNDLTQYYRPLFTIYLTFGYKVFGLWAPGWHLLNVIAHAAVTVMVYRLLRQLTGTRDIAFIAGLIFGIHTAHTESVAWISAIPDPMMALFYIPSLMWYHRFRTGGGTKHLLLATFAFALAVFCKETAMSLPALLVCWEMIHSAWRTRTAAWRAAVALAPFGIVAVVYMAARVAVLGSVTWKHPGMLSIPDHLIYMTIPFAFVSYLYHLVAPFDLSIIYGTSFVKGVGDPRFYVPVSILAALGLLICTQRRQLARGTWTALVFVIVPLLPVLNLKALHEEYIVQDRYLYLPLIGFGWIVALLLRHIARSHRAVSLSLGVAIALVMAVSTVIQNRMWLDSVALWQQATKYAPNFWSTQYNLGLAYLERREYTRAQAQFERALRIHPRPVIYNNLALAHAGAGRVDLAIENFRLALALDPAQVEAHNNLGTILYERGDFNGARQHFELALREEPNSITARFNAARVAASMNDHTTAVKEFKLLLAKTPQDIEARYKLAQSYAALDLRADAIAEMRRVLASEWDADRLTEIKREMDRLQLAH